MESSYTSTRLVVTGGVSHGIAIACTIFRLVYRGWTHHIWWEDAWAALSLISDVLCLACIWVYPSPKLPSWILAVAFTSVLWAARMSMIFSIIRISNHSGCKVHKWISYLIALSFLCMWIALLVQKINICIFDACQMSDSVALSQLITDVIADCALVAVPLQLWKNVGLSRSRKILVLSSFGTSILITALTIPLSVVLFYPTMLFGTALIFAHVRAAVSLIVCNVLVIVTCAYRVLLKENCDLDRSLTSPGIFSTVIWTQFPISTYTMTSTSQTTTARTKPQPDDTSMVSAEEGANAEGSGNVKASSDR
ncbi:uncharacterized protein EDB93DRAFT_766693 [Suillus bovinus]|uniref:uncharacterized protein n=1 Tax=Suillus bovinus TaxID=48563 RepID=UPI001B883617|nr:uncharacterized protein EDB93DRAFT_766693 [Suillus bovinus]KAG2137437.1 hypothetical protein EDB93DRAFT_766693 [Suillus bovinus]